MEIGIGLDPTLGLSYEEQAQVSAEAARAGYQSIWTPENIAEDSFLTCALRWQATRDVIPGGLGTGIGVSPVGLRTPMGFAMSAGTMGKMTGGRFVLGIGTGAAYNPQYRRTWNIRGSSTLGLMRDYLTTIRALLAGETVTHEGPSISLRGARLAINPPPRTPVYLAALGPEMCRLGGELADGISLNWCSAEQVAWSRERVAEGAERAGRDPKSIVVAEYIRVCVDEDVDVARRSFTRSVMSYALGPLGVPAQSYRAHFERMGFAAELAHVDTLRARNAPENEVVDAFPEALLKNVGYYGPASGAASAFQRLSEGLDTSIVRVVAARPGVEATMSVLKACAPGAASAK
ncbi:MAG TPA: LLM class flavin-dependent oxidoreductase [Dehalococcoidia bacterium]|nr:LLM class flavin-dependent oxidoreductase [Dehalococcoidia bacterium]